MSARAASGDAVTGTGPSVLTVSSRTEPDTGHPPATGTLTPDDANPPLRAHRESRRTAGYDPWKPSTVWVAKLASAMASFCWRRSFGRVTWWLA
jgi:hypothetical protein